ncbi:MAG: hypothetical protein IGS23_14375 [Rivularia sp. T60_A2020_040]|nr:hypothetical protein [Rivularia sp. T60_A2020_040]
MTESNNIFVLEWDKKVDDSEEYNLKVTPHSSAKTALEQTRNSQSEHHCVSTVNPLIGEGSEKK